MKQQLSKKEVVQQCRNYFKRLMDEAKPHAFTLNISLANNPFIKHKDGYKYLISQLKDYNQRVQKGMIADPYEMISFGKAHSMLSDIAQIDTREDQITALDSMIVWFKEQQRLVHQRYDQGYIRYEYSKDYKQFLEYKFDSDEVEEEQQLNIPFFLVERILEPFKEHWRTPHNHYEIPTRRLLEYKVKTLNILNLASDDNQKDDNRPARVLYPMPPKYEEPKEEEPEVKPEEAPAEGGQQPPLADGQKPPEGAPGEQAPEQPGMEGADMGGFGEEPGDPQDEEPPEDLPDKLKPRNPIYIEAIKAENERKYKQGYMLYKGNDTKEERNMDKRYIRIYHDQIRKNREELNQTQIAHEWAKRKSRIAKDMQKKLEEMKFRPEYSFSSQPQPDEERLAPQDEIKYGFTAAVRTRPKHSEFDLTLPNLKNASNFNFDEKTIRRDRINSLRTKFSKVLNLADHQDRQVAPSLCQFTSRRRGLSEIIRNHSHSKERLIQLEEVSRIKEKLTKVKVNVNVRALSKGLCLPENEDFYSDTAREFPVNQLPSNPDMIDTKKKKKKKK